MKNDTLYIFAVPVTRYVLAHNDDDHDDERSMMPHISGSNDIIQNTSLLATLCLASLIAIAAINKRAIVRCASNVFCKYLEYANANTKHRPADSAVALFCVCLCVCLCCCTEPDKQTANAKPNTTTLIVSSYVYGYECIHEPYIASNHSTLQTAIHHNLMKHNARKYAYTKTLAGPLARDRNIYKSSHDRKRARIQRLFAHTERINN